MNKLDNIYDIFITYKKLVEEEENKKKNKNYILSYRRNKNFILDIADKRGFDYKIIEELYEICKDTLSEEIINEAYNNLLNKTKNENI